MKVAFFDIDGTITHRSSERQFIRFLLEIRALSPVRMTVTAVYFILRHPLSFLQRGFKQNKMYLRGLAVERIRALAVQCFEQQIQPDIRQTLLMEIRRRKTDGWKVVLLSGSIRCLVEPMAALVGADDCIFSEVGQTNGNFTGSMTSMHPYGRTKKVLAEAWCRQNAFAMSDACAYANEIHDRYLMESVGEAIAVAPDSRLRSLAISRQWVVIE